MTEQILVIGATGTVGSALVRLLSGGPVRAASRDPEAARRILGPDVSVVEFDLEDPSTFPGALAGVDRVFLMARPGDDHPERTAVPLIDEMAARGVRHVVHLSAMGAESREDFGLRKVELRLEGSTMSFTHLRPNWFMQIFSSGPLHAGILATGCLRVPAGDAAISFIDARDIAAVAAAAFADPVHRDRAYTLTGPEPLGHGAVARAIAEASGRQVSYVPMDEKEARSALTRAGMDEARVQRLLDFYSLVRRGFCAPVSPDVERVLGRPAVDFFRFAADHAHAWRT